MTVAAAIPASTSRPRFDNAAEWLHSLGDIPPERIIFDPLPGTATEADLLRLVERDKRLCELIDGTLVEKPMGAWEAYVAARLVYFLWAFVEPRDLGGVFGADSTLRMKAGQVRLPDVAFISTERMPETREPIPSVAPDLAVEVLSESNTRREIARKLTEYFQSGTRLAWIIDPELRTAAIYHEPGQPTRTINENDLLDGEQVIPGFTLQLSKIFRGVPRT